MLKTATVSGIRIGGNTLFLDLRQIDSMRNVISALTCLLVLMACASTPAKQPAPVPSYDNPPDVTPDGLVRVADSVFDLAYVKPGLDFSRYKRIQIKPIQIAYKEPPRPARSNASQRNNLELTDQQRSNVSRMFAEEFAKAMIKDGRYVLADRPDYDTVLLRVALAQLEINIPTVPQRHDPMFYIDKAAEVTLVLELRDSGSGQPLARGRDTRSITPPSGSFRSSEPEELRYEARRVFAEWSTLLRNGFDRLSSPSLRDDQ